MAQAPDDKDLDLLRATMQAWIFAGNDRLFDRESRAQPISAHATKDLKAGLRAWHRYLTQTGGKAGTKLAELAGWAYFSLVEIGSTDPREAAANAAGAAKALRIACRHERHLLNLSNLATYEYFNGELAAGDAVAKQAALEVSKPRRPGVFAQLDGYRERAEKFLARVRRGTQTLRETGEKELETPIKGYGSTAGINGYEPS